MGGRRVGTGKSLQKFENFYEKCMKLLLRVSQIFCCVLMDYCIFVINYNSRTSPDVFVSFCGKLENVMRKEHVFPYFLAEYFQGHPPRRHSTYCVLNF